MFSKEGDTDESRFPTLQAADDAALHEIIEKFPNNDKLVQRIRTLRVHYETKKSNVEAKLSTLVQTNLDESRLALQLLRESCKNMEKIRRNFLEIKERCVECQKLLPDYGDIKQISTSRNNLALTIRLLKMFRSIPDHAEELFQQIKSTNNERPTRLKNVYLQLRKLVQLKEEALHEGVQYDSSLSKLMKGHFSVLQRLAQSLEDRI